MTRSIGVPFVAQVIRIVPVDWNKADASFKPALRVELYAMCLWAQDFRDEIGKGMVNGANGTSDFANVDWLVENPAANHPAQFQVVRDPVSGLAWLQVRNTGISTSTGVFFRKATPIYTSAYKR